MTRNAIRDISIVELLVEGMGIQLWVDRGCAPEYHYTLSRQLAGDEIDRFAEWAWWNVALIDIPFMRGQHEVLYGKQVVFRYDLQAVQ